MSLLSSLIAATLPPAIAAVLNVRRTTAVADRDHSTDELTARLGSDEDHTRLALLAEISQFLLASLDHRAAIVGLARMVLPALGDGCFISLDDGEQDRRLAIAHISPQKVRLLQELDTSGSLTWLTARAVANAVATGKAERGDRLTPEIWPPAARDNARWRDTASAVDVRAYLVIPLITRGRVLGVMAFLVTESDRKYTADDLEFAHHVARRAATAVDNLRLYEEARNAKQAAEDANRMKDEFLATLSHELRTPLNAILGWSRLLRAGHLDANMRDKAAATIERNALAQAQIVDDLLDVSRIITGSLRLDLHAVDIAALVQDAITANQPALHAKGIDVEAFLEPMGVILGDQRRLQQIAWNLLSNATKFTPAGGHVEVHLEQHDTDVQLSVRDNGMGISPEFLPHVFERFRQADSTTTRVYGGLGLGLAIVRHLVELHGGTVTAESPGVGKGSTFTVRIPLGPEHR